MSYRMMFLAAIGAALVQSATPARAADQIRFSYTLRYITDVNSHLFIACEGPGHLSPCGQFAGGTTFFHERRDQFYHFYTAQTIIREFPPWGAWKCEAFKDSLFGICNGSASNAVNFNVDRPK